MSNNVLITRSATMIDGSVKFDELIATNASVHLEAMDDDHWWMSVEVDGRMVHVNFATSNETEIDVMVEEQ